MYEPIDLKTSDWDIINEAFGEQKIKDMQARLNMDLDLKIYINYLMNKCAYAAFNLGRKKALKEQSDEN